MRTQVTQEIVGPSGGAAAPVVPAEEVVSGAAALLFLVNTRGACTWVNPEWTWLTGSPREEALGDGWLRRLDPGDRQRLLEDQRRAVAERRAVQLEYRMSLPERNPIWMESTLSPRYDAAGKLVGFVGVGFDVTARRHAQDRLRTRERQQTILARLARAAIRDQTPLGQFLNAEAEIRHATDADLALLFRITGEGVCEWVAGTESAQLASERRLSRRMHGLPPQSDSGPLQLLDLIDPSQRDEVSAINMPSLLENGFWTGESQMRNLETGREIDVLLDAFTIPDPATGQTAWTGGVARDISERKRMEQALRRSQELLTATQAMTGVGSWEWVPATGEVLWSEQAYRIFGREPSPVPGFASGLARIVPADRERVESVLWNAVSGGSEFRLDYRIKLPDGRVRRIEAVGRACLDASGRTQKLLGFVRDITAAAAERGPFARLESGATPGLAVSGSPERATGKRRRSGRRAADAQATAPSGLDEKAPAADAPCGSRARSGKR